MVDVVVIAFGEWICRLLLLELGGGSSAAATAGIIVATLGAVAYVTVRIAVNGQTIGMRVMNIRCVDAADGRYPIGFGRSSIRWLSGAVFGICVQPAIVDLLWPIWDPLRGRADW